MFLNNSLQKNVLCYCIYWNTYHLYLSDRKRFISWLQVKSIICSHLFTSLLSFIKVSHFSTTERIILSNFLLGFLRIAISLKCVHFFKKIHIIFYSIIYLQQSWSLKLYKSLLLSEDKCYNPIFLKKLQH